MKWRKFATLMVVAALTTMAACSAPDERDAEDRSKATLQLDDGDYLYVSEVSPLLDEQSHTSYFPDLLNVFLVSPATDEEAQSIAAVVDGEVVGRISGGMDMIQVLLDAPDLASLERARAELLGADPVQFVALEHPAQPADLGTPLPTAQGAWAATAGLFPREERGDGRWWIEVTGADHVWQAREQFPQYFEDSVALSVFENTTIDPADLNSGPEHQANWQDAAHTMSVARFAAASPDGDGVAGVGRASTVLSHSLDWKPKWWRVDRWFSRTSNMTYAFKKAVEQADDAGGNVVVNVSAGHRFCTSEGWHDPEVDCGKGAPRGSFEAYEEFARQQARGSAEDMLRGLIQLKERGLDPLVVQAAGNGPRDVDFSRLEPLSSPPDARSSGLFAGIDESLFEQVCPPDDCSTTFEEASGNIIVVGAMDRLGDEYEASFWAHTGDTIDLLAPGSELTAPWEEKLKTGTSFAAPMVSGTALTVWSMDASLAAHEVKARILDASDAELSRHGLTYPTLNSWGAVLATANDLGLEFRDEQEQVLAAYDQLLDDDASFLPSDRDETDYFGSWPGGPDYEGDRNVIRHSYALVDITGDGHPELLTSAQAMDFEYVRVFSAIPSNTGVNVVEYPQGIVWGVATSGGGRIGLGISESKPGLFEFAGHSLSPVGTLIHHQFSHNEQFEGTVTSETLGEYEAPSDAVADFVGFGDVQRYERGDREPFVRE